MAFVSYGSYQWDQNAVWFTRHLRPIIGKTGRRNFIHNQWILNGRVNGANTAEVDTARVNMENALIDGQDLVFSLGTTQNLISANCVNGTKIRSLDWLPGYDGARGSGAEDVFRRTFRLIIDGLVRVTSDTDIIEWHEQVTGTGTGGPRTLPVGSLTGYVTAQQTQLYTKCEAVQTGYAVGLTGYPPAASPIWVSGAGGVYEYFERRRNSLSSPQQIGINQNTGYRRSWSYQFFSTVGPIVGSPSIF